MDLKELDELIGNVNAVARTVSTVRGNIHGRPAAFSTNERQTRSGLIDPVLKILGWDVSQVELVGSEYRTKSSGIADYALFSGTDPIALIEAKSLGSELDVRIVEQLSNYTSNEPTVRFALFTNGDHWRMRETGKSGTVIDIHLSKESPLKSALELMRLWRDVLVDGQSEAREDGSQIRSNNAIGPDSTDDKNRSRSPIQQTDASKNQESAMTDGWMTLDDVGFLTGDQRPKGLALPGEDPDEIKSYKDLWVEIVEWLLKNASPVEWDRYFCDRFASVRPPDHRSQPSPRQLSNELWLATNFSTVATGKNIKNALRHFAVDMRTIGVTFEAEIVRNWHSSSSTVESDLVSGRADLRSNPHRVTKPQERDVSPKILARRTLIHESAHAGSPTVERTDAEWLSVGDRSWSAIHRDPKQVRIADKTFDVGEWAEFTQLLAAWLVDTGKLKREDCPVSVTRSGNKSLVNTAPIHPDGSDFIAPRRLPSHMWIQTNHGAHQHVEYAARLLRKFGLDPNTVMVKID